MTVPCASRSVQSAVNTSVVSQEPPHDSHCCIGVLPIRTGFIDAWQLGQGNGTPPSSTAASARAPQCGQNCEPANIDAKQDGHVTVLSADAQYSQRTASGAAGAPQLGQLSGADMTFVRRAAARRRHAPIPAVSALTPHDPLDGRRLWLCSVVVDGPDVSGDAHRIGVADVAGMRNHDRTTHPVSIDIKDRTQLAAQGVLPRMRL